MKKLSKILAVLLTVCVLVGLTAIAVMAAISTTPKTADDATGVIKQQTAKSFTNSGSKQCGSCDNNTLTLSHNGGSCTCANVAGAYAFGFDSLIYKAKVDATDTDPAIPAINYFSAKGKDFLTVDFDFSAETENNGVLSYAENVYLSIFDTKYSSFYVPLLYFVYNEIDNLWYLSTDKVFDSNDFALAESVGQRNHITLVDTGTAVWIYLDGEFITSYAGTHRNSAYLRPGFTSKGTAAGDYSIKFENVVASLYTSDENENEYSSGSSYGLDDYIAANNTSIPLYKCEDIVYTQNYIFDDAVDGQDAGTIQIGDGDPTSYQNTAQIYDALSALDSLENVTVTTRKNIDADFILNNIFADGFKIIATNGAKVTSSVSDIIYNNGTYTFKASIQAVLSNGTTIGCTPFMLSQLSASELTGATIYTNKNIDTDSFAIGAKGFKIICSDGASVTGGTNYKLVSYSNSDGDKTYIINQLDAHILNSSYIVNSIAYDFDNKGDLTDYGAPSLTDMATISKITSSNGNIYTKVTPTGKFVSPGTENKLPSALVNPRLLINTGSTQKDNLTFGTYKYTVIDVDIATDDIYFNDTVSCISLGIYPYVSAYSYFAYILKDTETNSFYLSTNKSLEKAKDIPLSSETGVWNHITLVMDSTTLSSTVVYVYLDGEYVGQNTFALTSSSWLRFFAFQFDDLSGTEAATTKFDLCVDNLAINFYNNNYIKATGCSYSIVDYFGATDVNTSVPLYKCEDIVYNKYYQYINVLASQDKAVSITKNDVTKDYNVFEYLDAITDLKNESTLENVTITTRKNLDLSALGAKVLDSGFKVVVTNGATVTCSSDYRIINNEGTVTFDYPVKVALADGETVKNFTVLNYVDELKKLTATELKGATITTIKAIDVDTLVYGAGSFTVVALDGAQITGGTKYLLTSDGNTYTAKYNQLDAAHFGNNINNILASSDSFSDVFGNNSAKYTRGSSTNDGNTYYRFYYAEKATNVTSLGGNGFLYSGALNLQNNDYTVIDFDFASDKYLVNNKISDTGTKLAYPENLSISHLTLGTDSSVYIVYDEASASWYASDSKDKQSKNAIPLANEPGVWNHLTFVIKTTTKGESSGTVYIFVDGQYLTSGATSNLSNVTDNNASRILISFSDVVCDAFSLAIDNIAVNAYGTATTSYTKSSDCGYSITDYFSGEDYKTKSLYKCEDIVFNTKYEFESSDVVVKIDGVDSWGIFDDYITEIGELTAEQLEGKTIVTRKNLKGLTLPAGLEFVYVKSNNGAVLSSLDGSTYGFREAAVGEDYDFVIYKADKTVEVTWKYGDKIIHTSLEPKEVRLNRNSLIHTPVYFVDGKYYVFQSWTSEYFDKPVGDSDIVVEANYVEKTFAELGLVFTVITKDKLNPTYDTLFTTLELGIEKYTDVKNSVDIVNALEEDATAEVVLYADFDMGDKWYKIKDGSTITFDLNGHYIKQLGKIGAYVRTPIFKIYDNSTFNLNSSKSGAELYQLQWRSGANSDDISFGIIYAPVDTDGYTVNVQGENISFYAGSVITADEAETAGNDKKVTININGGKYYTLALTTTAKKKGGLFALHAANVTCTVNNITAVTAEKSITAIFTLTANTKLNVSNSTLVDATDGNGTAIIDSVPGNTTVEFTGCSFIGYKFAGDSSFSGKLILNNGNKFDARMDIVSYYITNKEITVKEGYQFALGGNTVITTEGIQYPTVTYPEKTADKSALVTLGAMINIDAEGSKYYLEIRPDSEIVTVTWKKPDGTDYRVEKWINKSNITLLDATVFGVKETYNNWYDEVYSVWLNGKTRVKDGYELTEDITLTPAGGLVVEDISAIRYNMSLTSSFKANIYLPKILGAGMEFLGFYKVVPTDEGGMIIVDKYGNLVSIDKATQETEGLSITKLNGRDYTTYSFAFDTDAIDENVTVYVVLEVELNGDKSIIYKEVNISLLKYADAIVKAYKCGSDESILAYNLINYANEAYQFNNKDTLTEDDVHVAAAKEFLKKYENCTCKTIFKANKDTAVNTANDAFKAYATDISYEISGEYAGFVLHLAEDSKVTAGTVYVAGVEIADMKLSDDGKHLYADIPLYLVSDTMTFTIEGVSCEFNLAYYATSEAGNIPVINALYSLSVIAKDYKDNTND